MSLPLRLTSLTSNGGRSSTLGRPVFLIEIGSQMESREHLSVSSHYLLRDTNVLLRSVQDDHPQCRTARDAINICRSSGQQIVLIPQVLYESWVVSTGPVDQNGLGLNLAEALAKLNELLELLTLLRDERLVFDRWLALMDSRRHGQSGTRRPSGRRNAAPRRDSNNDVQCPGLWTIPKRRVSIAGAVAFLSPGHR